MGVKQIVRLKVDVVAKDDQHILRFLEWLAGELDVASGEDCSVHFRKTAYNHKDTWGNIVATVERHGDAMWEFEDTPNAEGQRP